MMEQFLFQTNKMRNEKVPFVAVLGLSIATGLVNILGAYSVVVPGIYGILGQLLYGNSGWSFFQPGIGGPRFVALNGVAWSLYAVSLLFQLVNVIFHHDALLAMFSMACGQLSFACMISALLVYRTPTTTQDENSLRHQVFTSENVLKYMVNSGDLSPSALWWLFIGSQIMASSAGVTITFLAYIHGTSNLMKIGAAFISIALSACTTAMTHTLGGQWLHIQKPYEGFQPGRGGKAYISFQAAGWSCLGLSHFLFCVFALMVASPQVLPIIGITGLMSQILITISLFTFDENAKPAQENTILLFRLVPKKDWVFDLLVKTHFLGMNLIFGNLNSKYSRQVKLQGFEDYKLGDEKFKELTKNCTRTGDQYLVIGVGFVGKRLVQCLLDRGEDRIRLFDISPVNPFQGDSRVEFIRGDVTKIDQIRQACRGVDTVYSTFAIIRFMDRLEHQAALSFQINVVGTEKVIEACCAENVKRMVVTSSSHATTDEHSEPRYNRDENAPYVTRDTSHNHYGWTKAIADQLALKANNSITSNGGKLLVSIVRPCSGVFGPDDRFSLEKALDMQIYPGVGATYVMDWVFVMNVVLGHLLCEQKLQEQAQGVAGEAFNISNNEACSMEEFMWSVNSVISNHVEKSKVQSRLELLYIPMAPIYALAYISEFVQNTWKGKVSLGRDLDSLTPATLSTVCMNYSYNSDKAKKFLGYEPAYSLDMAIQKSVLEYWENKYPSTTLTYKKQV